MRKNVLVKKYPFTRENTTRKIYAMGLVKYPSNSFLNIFKILLFIIMSLKIDSVRAAEADV